MRTPLVAMLIAAEVFLVGLMIYAVKGGHAGWVSADAAGFPLHQVGFKATPIAPMAAGLSPDVTIDDPDAHVTVDVSNDGLVHVEDLTSITGMVWGNSSIAPLRVERSANGVRITRAGGENEVLSLGDLEVAIRVDVPAGSRLTLGHSSGADITGITGGVNAISQDGHISLKSLRGDVTAHSDDGRIEANDIDGGRIDLSTEDGRMRLSDLTASSLDANTEDGSIEADRLAVSGSGARAVIHTGDGSIHAGGVFGGSGNYEISSSDGSVTAQLAGGSNATVVASTNDGSITIDGNSYSGEDSAQHTVRVGDGSAKMRVSTEDGAIHLTTNGAQ